MILYRYVTVYIIAHSRHLHVSIVYASCQLIHTQHCRQIVLRSKVFVVAQTDVKLSFILFYSNMYMYRSSP